MIQGFTFIQTQDGSPSLRFRTDQGDSEPMHSLNGALSETIYIYGQALDLALQAGMPLHICSLGLGLGYNEILTAALSFKRAVLQNPADPLSALSSISGESFEAVPELSSYFASWAMGRTDIPIDFKNAYDFILQELSRKLSIEGSLIHALLATWLESGQWLLREALTSQSEFFQPYGVLLFDAFSSKSSPDLWQEEFLNSFFTQACARHCIFSTYACTGTLKRALKNAGFEVQIRPGFSGKRESTFAVRSPATQSGLLP